MKTPCFHCGDSEEAVCVSCADTTNPLLTGIKVDDRTKLDEGRSTLKYKKGELIFREGMLPSGLICLNKGKVMVTQKDQYENKVVIQLQKGVSFLGIADFFSDTPYQTDGMALEDCTVCMIRRDKVQELMAINRFYVKNILDEISNQLRQANKRLLSLTKKHMYARLADALLLIHEVFGVKEDGRTLNVYMKRKDMAILSNMNVANVIRHLSTFQREGIVNIDQKDVQIIDLDKLVKMSNHL